MKRLTELDVLRGILLLMMVVNHSPSPLRRVTDQPLGFFTTAEGFVFVSAFLAGMLFRKRTERHGFARARSSTIRRAWYIYRAHLLTLAFAFVIGGFLLTEFPGTENLLDRYLENPWAAIAASPLLVFQPPLLDILPMYILFSLLTPLAFWAADRWGWKAVVLTSLSVWLISQTRVRDALVSASQGISYIELGSFDILAWQLLWIGGVFFGQRFHENKSALPVPGVLQGVLWFLAIGFLVWRWSSIGFGSDPSNRNWLLDKWHLGPLRLMNFFATGWIIAKFIRYLEHLEIPLRPFSLIGRHMLPVFCCETCLSVLLIGIAESPRGGEPLTSFLVICQVLTAFLLAWFFDERSPCKNPMASQPCLNSPALQPELLKAGPLTSNDLRRPPGKGEGPKVRSVRF